MNNKSFTHLSDKGVHMVEVSDKPVVKRTAIAQGKIHLKKETIELIEKEEIKKGNVLTTAQIAAIGAVKSTHHLIPLCHSLKITGVDVGFDLNKETIEVEVSVTSLGKTGVEMEAITGVSVALLTIWDMVKSVEKDDNGQYPSTRISDIVVVKKEKK
ncbi:MAG: cyclic pyranopterin monophosphate synthase MoaC [Methanobacterium sp.]|uniref:cyclic pyranopterin monophosphate synthase MoaC n=1 Tax=Methanobacterium sp. TaxID=2164 RepID=UPI003D64B989|nr:cyclic pyranopterin monophosphate synthase MoaC [Methanobacterium sp.]